MSDPFLIKATVGGGKTFGEACYDRGAHHIFSEVFLNLGA